MKSLAVNCDVNRTSFIQCVLNCDSPCSGCVVGLERGAVALFSEAVSGLITGAGNHGLGLSRSFALLCHGLVPLTSCFLQPASSQTPFLQVDPTQLIVYGWVVQKVQSQQYHDEESIDPHTNQGCIITGANRETVLTEYNLGKVTINPQSCHRESFKICLNSQWLCWSCQVIMFAVHMARPKHFSNPALTKI